MTDKALVNFSGSPFDGTVTVNRQELDISRGKPGEQLWAAARAYYCSRPTRAFREPR